MQLQKKNALIKFHLELAFEWDADAQTRDFWIEALRHASTLLYDVTDGHACIGSVKVLNNHRYSTRYGEPMGVPRNAIQVFADNDVRAYVWHSYGAHFGRMWRGSIIGDWREIQPELLGSVLAHEFGHSLLLLPDEYEETDSGSVPRCVKGEIDVNPGQDPYSSVACLMASPWDVSRDGREPVTVGNSQLSLYEAWFKASELCNGRPGRHTFEFKKVGDKEVKVEDCWTTFRKNFSDKQKPERWHILTPVERGVDVVPGPAKVISYTKPTRGRFIEVAEKKDDIGEEMEVDLSQWQYNGGRRVKVQPVRMPERTPMDARFGIFSHGLWIYQGRTYDKEKEGKIVKEIEIEGYHNGEMVDVFAGNRRALIAFPGGTSELNLEVWPSEYPNICRIEIKEIKNSNLLLSVSIDRQSIISVSKIFVQMVVQDSVKYKGCRA